MKNLLFIAVLTMFSMLAFTNDANAKEIVIDETVTDSDGCVWHITGVIDVNVEWGWPPVSINSYNITMSGPCGKHHFEGLAHFVPSPDGGVNISGSLTDVINNQSQLLSTPSLIFIIHYLEAKYDE